MAKSLEAFTGLALDRAPALAARLLGSAEALRERTGRPVTPVYRPLVDRCRERLRAHLDDTIFAAQRDAGRIAPLDQVVTETLSWAAKTASG